MAERVGISGGIEERTHIAESGNGMVRQLLAVEREIDTKGRRVYNAYGP